MHNPLRLGKRRFRLQPPELLCVGSGGLPTYGDGIPQVLQTGSRGNLDAWFSETVRLLSEPLLITAAAQLAVWPITPYHFHRLSLVSPLTNFLIIPAQAGMIEPVYTAHPYVVELADLFAELTEEEKEEILAGARWKAERKEGHQPGSIQGVA